MKRQLIGKDPDAGKDWVQEEKSMTEDEMVGCIIDSEDMNLTKLWETVKEQGRQVCCSLWSHKELDKT